MFSFCLYCNTILYGTSAVVIRRLQMVLNAAARLVAGLGKYQHITPVLRDVLHWLSVPQRIQFKNATLIFDCNSMRTEPERAGC